MKCDCNPKYTIPYVKVCDNIYLTKWVLASALSLYKSTYPVPPFEYVFHSQVDWPPSAGVSKNALPLPIVQKNTAVILQSYVFAFVLSFQVLTEFNVRAGSYALLQQQGTQVFLREKIFTFTMSGRVAVHKKHYQATLALGFLPVSLLPRIYEIELIPCCTCTIHKGYYIVLHSSPFSRLSYSVSSPFFPFKKISSALVFKSSSLMVDVQQLWNFHSWVLKIANHYLAAMTDD